MPNETTIIKPGTVAERGTSIKPGTVAGSGEGQNLSDAHTRSALPETINELSKLIQDVKHLHVEHRGLQRNRGDMDRRIKSAERGIAATRQGLIVDGDSFKFPEPNEEDKAQAQLDYGRLYRAQEMIEFLRKQTHKELCDKAAQLPVAEWIAGVKGVSYGSLGAIIAESGDLSRYRSVAALWKRLGLHVVDGKAPKTAAGQCLGFNPARRVEVYLIGECLLKNKGYYREVYLERKAYEQERAAELGLTILPQSKISHKKEEERAKYRSEGHVHRRAMRYMEKRFIRDLYNAWKHAVAATEE